jgi:TonB family protein
LQLSFGRPSSSIENAEALRRGDPRRRIAPVLSLPDAPMDSGGRASLEATMPPTPLRQQLAADGAAIAMLTADGELSETAHRAAGRRYPIELASSWSQLMHELSRGNTGVVLIDTEFVSGQLVERLEQLQAAHPSTVVLIAARREAAQKLMQLLIDRQVYRLLLKPASVEETRLLFESAVDRCLRPREDAGRPAAMVTEARGPRTARWLMGAAAFFATLLISEMVLAPLQSGAGDVAELPVSIVSTTSNESAETVALADRAASAPQSQGTTPVALVAPHTPATDGATTDGPITDLAATDTPATHLAATHLAATDSRVTAESPTPIDPNADEVADADIFFNPYLESQLDLAEQRLAEGRLLTPLGDGAVAYLEHAASIQQESVRLLELRDAVATALIERVPDALAAGDLDRADALIATAFSLGGDADVLSRLDRDLDAALAARAAEEEARERELGALDAERLQAELLAAPVSMADLEFQATGSVDYPPDARTSGVEGSVRLEFIVDTDGRPSSPRVVDADPPGWFESAALAAIRDYRFRPYERDGVAYRRLVRARIGFALD